MKSFSHRFNLLSFFTGVALVTGGCATYKSKNTMSPYEAGDKTLVISGCETSLSRGVDVCRFVEGSSVESEINFWLPTIEGEAQGEVRVRYRDQVRAFSVNSSKVIIPWKEITGEDYWQLKDEGLVQISGSVKFREGSVVRVIRVLGYAYAIVLKQGYSPFVISSEPSIFNQTCRMEYDADGASYLRCDRD